MVRSARHPKKGARNFKDISHYFLSAAEADASHDAMGTAGHLKTSSAPTTSDKRPASPTSSSKPARRKENCASCTHLIARAGQPFQCRIFSSQYAEYNLEHRDSIRIDEGHTCPLFMRVTSKQIQDILRSHGSSLSSEQVREYPHSVEKQSPLDKTITFSPHGGINAGENLREELLRYLFEGYSVIEATVAREENHSDDTHSKTSLQKIRLRLKKED